MELDDILEMDPESNCVVHHELTENWKSCYYQYKNDSPDPDGKIVSKFDEKYNESGWGDLGYDHESVFDPTQEVHYESYLDTIFTREMTSSNFIGLIQRKIEEYKSEETGEDFDEFIEWLGLGTGHGFLEELCDEIGCSDYKMTIEKEDNSYLWFSHYELSEESQEFWIEEVQKKDTKRVKEKLEKGGIKKDYFKNGELKGEGNYKNGKKDGLWKLYFENGELKGEGNYKNGKKDGLWKYWEFVKWDDDYSFVESTEKNYKNGLEHGSFKSLFDNGEIYKEGNYLEGRKDGLWKDYYPNGGIWEEKTFKGMDNSSKTYSESGQLENESIFVYNLGDKEPSERKNIYKSICGQLYDRIIDKLLPLSISECTSWREYFENGQMMKEKIWIEDNLIFHNCWDENGNEIECKED